MKISCILTSYNRPRLVRQALLSVAYQGHRDWELIVIDDSDSEDMDIWEAVSEHETVFRFNRIHVLHENVKPEERRRVNRLGININNGLQLATGDLVCYLADDDYYFPDWFEKAASFFEKYPDKKVGFGRLKHSTDPKMDIEESGTFSYASGIVKEPMGVLDHNQVMHRRFSPPHLWSADVGTVMNVDGWYFSALANHYDFHPIDAWAAVKREHGKNLQKCVSEYQGGKIGGLRE